MSSRTKKWIVGVLAFVLMWLGWGFNEEANIVNNIGYFGMLGAFIIWTESAEARREAKEWREWATKHIGELHHHNVPKE